MLRKRLFHQIAVAAVLLSGAGTLLAQQAQFAPGEVIVKFRSNITTAQAQTTFSNAGLAQRVYFPQIGAYLCNITNEQSVDNAVQACQADPTVEYAEPNYTYTTLEHFMRRAEPNDPRLDDLYAMQNGNDADIDAIEAWDKQTGSKDILLAVIDTGVDYNHPDLKANMWVNPGESGDGKENNGVDDDNNGYIDDYRGWDFAGNDNNPMDDNGHGTHCAGTIGAVGDNGVGVVGVNWAVSILALKFLDSNGSGKLSDAIPAVLYAADMGARLSSNSWGGGGFSQALKDAIDYARSKNSIFVAAAGNSNEDNDSVDNYPSNYDVDNVIAVAASDRNDNLASFSNIGKQTVHLAAPGVDILSCQPGNNYQYLSGTSMATPHVSGVLGLVLAQYPGMTYREAMTRVLGGVDSKSEFKNTTSSGGRLNANNALSDSPKVAFVTRLENTDNSSNPYQVEAEAIDEGTVSAVKLKYNVSGGALQEVEMTHTEGAKYGAAIPAQALNSNVAYFVEAVDNDGNSGTSAEFSFEVKEGGGGGGICGSLVFSGSSNNNQGWFFLANMLVLISLIWLIGRRNRLAHVRSKK
ncbi:MAG: S8 family serine peptidase [Deferribacteres bacterium]|nr:S8 family serine peptidase [Deferribacteres bacterium]